MWNLLGMPRFPRILAVSQADPQGNLGDPWGIPGASPGGSPLEPRGILGEFWRDPRGIRGARGNEALAIASA